MENPKESFELKKPYGIAINNYIEDATQDDTTIEHVMSLSIAEMWAGWLEFKRIHRMNDKDIIYKHKIII